MVHLLHRILEKIIVEDICHRKTEEKQHKHGTHKKAVRRKNKQTEYLKEQKQGEEKRH